MRTHACTSSARLFHYKCKALATWPGGGRASKPNRPDIYTGTCWEARFRSSQAIAKIRRQKLLLAPPPSPHTHPFTIAPLKNFPRFWNLSPAHPFNPHPLTRSLSTFWWVSVVLALLAGPLNGEVAKWLEVLQQRGLGNVPGNPSQEDPGRVGGVLVPPWGKLTTPCAHHLRT